MFIARAMYGLTYVTVACLLIQFQSAEVTRKVTSSFE